MTNDPGDERGVGKRTDANADVDPFIGERNDAIEEMNADVELRMLSQQLHHDRHHVQLAKEHGGRDRHLATKRSGGIDRRFEELELRERAPAPLEVPLTLARDRYGPRRSVEKARP